MLPAHVSRPLLLHVSPGFTLDKSLILRAHFPAMAEAYTPTSPAANLEMV